MTDRIVEVTGLKTSFYTTQGEVEAIRGIDFHVRRGEALGIVGESGSGKSVTMLSVMGLLSDPGRVKAGTIVFKGQHLETKPESQMLKIRGNEISMIFQDPQTSLNPVITIGKQIMEPLLRHTGMTRAETRARAIDLLRLVEIPLPEKRFHQYPHELSGGMQQRCMIAMALACEPDLLIADEPTTALDVTIQAQIIDLMRGLLKTLDTAIILITHDLGVVADICDRIIVMYGGMIMESGTRNEIFYNARHPYTIGLLGSVPTVEMEKSRRLVTIPGSPPDLLHPPAGCPFAKRCDHAMNICLRQAAPMIRIDEEHSVKCWMAHDAYREFREAKS